MLVRTIPDISLGILTVGLSHMNIWVELQRQLLLTRVTRRLRLAALLLAVLGEKNGSVKNLGHSLKREEMLAACSQHWDRMEKKNMSTKRTKTNKYMKNKTQWDDGQPSDVSRLLDTRASHCPCCLSRRSRYSLADLQSLQCKPNLVRIRWYSL